MDELINLLNGAAERLDVHAENESDVIAADLAQKLREMAQNVNYCDDLCIQNAERIAELEKQLAESEAKYERLRSAVNGSIPRDLEYMAALEKQLEAAKIRLDYVHKMGLRFGMMKTSDKPEPYLGHIWMENSDHERMFREWSHSIGWEQRVEELQACAAAEAEGLEKWKAEAESKDNTIEILRAILSTLADERVSTLQALDSMNLQHERMRDLAGCNGKELSQRLEEIFAELEEVKRERDEARRNWGFHQAANNMEAKEAMRLAMELDKARAERDELKKKLTCSKLLLN